MSLSLNKISHNSRYRAVSLCRALSKMGYCSRTQAVLVIKEGRVRVNSRIEYDPDFRVALDHDSIEIDGRPMAMKNKLYIMLNKPRGLVTTASDDQGRKTVYECLPKDQLQWIAPVGRLDKASEGLLLFTNDNQLAAQLMDPGKHVDKTYHVRINCIADADLLKKLRDGVRDSDQKLLFVKSVKEIRHGAKNSWLEIVLDEGKNRQIRRILYGLDIEVLRLIRISIGPINLGTLAKGAYRYLTDQEIQALKKAVA